MIRKSLSLTTAIGLLYVYLQSQLRSGDALFLVLSPNTLINLLLLAAAAVAVKLSFSDEFQSWRTYLAAAAGASIISLIGLGGIIYSSLGNVFSGMMLPFDYFILLQLGVIYGLICVSYNHPPVKFSLPAYHYSIALQRTRQQLSGFMNRPVILPGRHSSGSTAA